LYKMMMKTAGGKINKEIISGTLKRLSGNIT
jgi:hypothetical protein